MVLYQYLNRQLISNGYLFSSVYTFAENTRVNNFVIITIIHSSQVLVDCTKSRHLSTNEHTNFGLSKKGKNITVQ